MTVVTVGSAVALAVGVAGNVAALVADIGFVGADFVQVGLGVEEFSDLRLQPLQRFFCGVQLVYF